MSFYAREELLIEDTDMSNHDNHPDDGDALMALPPGEEAAYLSNAGGTDEIFEDILHQFQSPK